MLYGKFVLLAGGWFFALLSTESITLGHMSFSIQRISGRGVGENCGENTALVSFYRSNTTLDFLWLLPSVMCFLSSRMQVFNGLAQTKRQKTI